MEKETVILLHGLGETPLRMALMEIALRAAGYRTLNYSYPSTLFPVEHLVDEFLAPLLAKHEQEPVLHFVTHSLGGVLLRYQALQTPIHNMGRAVMLAPAHHGSAIMDLYSKIPLFLAFNGPTALQSGVGEHCFPCQLSEEVNFPVGIIAGCVPSDPLSLMLLPWPHDGRTSVEDTKLKGMSDHLMVMASHETITFDPWTIGQTVFFLKHGHFAKLGGVQLRIAS